MGGADLVIGAATSAELGRPVPQELVERCAEGPRALWANVLGESPVEMAAEAGLTADALSMRRDRSLAKIRQFRSAA